MPIGGNLTLLKGLLYRLKRSFGCPLAVYVQTPEAIDYTTGRASVGKSSIQIKRAIVLPSQVHRSFSYDIGYLKANSNFTYGGIFTDSQRQIILDRADLPKGFTLDATDKYYIVYDEKRWEIKAVSQFEHKLAYYLTVSNVDGAIVNDIHNLFVRESLCYYEDIVGGTQEVQFLNIVDELEFSDTATESLPLHSQIIFDTLTLLDEAGGNIL
jgi:hypothetical protein